MAATYDDTDTENGRDVTRQVYQRITRLEATQLQMSQQLAGIASNLDSLAKEFQSARRPQWQLLLSGIAIFVSLFGMGGAILALAGRSAIAPVDQKASTNAVAISEIKERMGRIQEASDDRAALLREVGTRQAEKFAEVETQFRALSNQSNMRQSEHDRLLRLLWRRAYNEELPGNGIWPVVGRE